MDREERELAEREERLARKRALREQQLKKKKQEEQLMIGGGIILLAVIVTVIVLIAKSCGKNKDPEESAGPKTQTEETAETRDNPEGTEDTKASEKEADTQAPQESTAPEDSTDDTSENGAETQPSSEETIVPTSAAPEMPVGNWDLSTLNNDLVYFGYAEVNRDPVTHIPTDWAWYESMWGKFNVDWIQDTSQNIIYLTMDEGYPNEYTSTILDILAEKNVKACFFITQMFLDGGEQSNAQIQRMVNEGHVIGNHSVHHKNMPTLSIEEQISEIQTVNQHLKDLFGVDCKLFRFPEGVYSEQSLGVVDNLGMKTCFWSYAYNDYSEEQPPVEESLQKAIDGLHPGAIYLLHANSSTNTAFLARWIDAARERGFEFGVYPQTAN